VSFRTWLFSEKNSRAKSIGGGGGGGERWSHAPVIIPSFLVAQGKSAKKHDREIYLFRSQYSLLVCYISFTRTAPTASCRVDLCNRSTSHVSVAAERTIKSVVTKYVQRDTV